MTIPGVGLIANMTFTQINQGLENKTLMTGSTSEQQRIAQSILQKAKGASPEEYEAASKALVLVEKNLTQLTNPSLFSWIYSIFAEMPSTEIKSGDVGRLQQQIVSLHQEISLYNKVYPGIQTFLAQQAPGKNAQELAKDASALANQVIKFHQEMQKNKNTLYNVPAAEYSILGNVFDYEIILHPEDRSPIQIHLYRQEENPPRVFVLPFSEDLTPEQAMVFPRQQGIVLPSLPPQSTVPGLDELRDELNELLDELDALPEIPATPSGAQPPAPVSPDAAPIPHHLLNSPAYKPLYEMLTAYFNGVYDDDQIRRYTAVIVEQVMTKQSEVGSNDKSLVFRIRKAQNQERMVPVPIASCPTAPYDPKYDAVPFTVRLTVLPGQKAYLLQVILPRSEPKGGAERPSRDFIGGGTYKRVKRAPTLILGSNLEPQSERETVLSRSRVVKGIGTVENLRNDMNAGIRAHFALMQRLEGSRAKLVGLPQLADYQSKNQGIRAEASQEYMNGTVDDLRFNKPLPTSMRPDASKRVVTPLEKMGALIDNADSLEAMHDVNIVHRDIKGANLLVSIRGETVEGWISDFDLTIEEGSLDFRFGYYPYWDTASNFGFVTRSNDQYGIILTACETMIPEISWDKHPERNLDTPQKRQAMWGTIVSNRLFEAQNSTEDNPEAERQIALGQQQLVSDPSNATQIAITSLQTALQKPNLTPVQKTALLRGIAQIEAQEILFNLLGDAIQQQSPELLGLMNQLEPNQDKEIPKAVKDAIFREMANFKTHEELFRFIALQMNPTLPPPLVTGHPQLPLTNAQKDVFIEGLSGEAQVSYKSLQRIIHNTMALADAKQRTAWFNTLPSDQRIVSDLNRAKNILARAEELLPVDQTP